MTIQLRWPENGQGHRPITLVARNDGRAELRNFQLNTIFLGYHTVIFDSISELAPKVDEQIRYRIADSNGEADLLDLLEMNKSSEVSPVTYRVNAQVERIDGHVQKLSYSLTYARLHDPRMGGREIELCTTFEQL